MTDRTTERQRRNSRALARNRGLVSGVGAVAFGLIGLMYGLLADVEWLGPVTGTVVGVLLGAGLGWGFSVDNDRSGRPRGPRRLLYGVVLVLAVVVLAGMRYIRAST